MSEMNHVRQLESFGLSCLGGTFSFKNDLLHKNESGSMAEWNNGRRGKPVQKPVLYLKKYLHEELFFLL